MKRFLLINLLALPLAAQYPAGAVFQRGDDPRWADPNFDDRQWVKQSDYRANSYDDYLQNRSWLRARVTIPAGEPAVIVSQHCPCEFYVNGLRVAAIGDLNQARPHTPPGIRIFPLPAGIPPGEAVFAVRRYNPPGLESVSPLVASAGHPAPWLDGREVALTAGLPLGIVAHAEFDESSVPLTHGQQLTLVSDGVVEAENAQRELFGFDRTREISTKSVQEIAEAAKAWGQNDDITVVTVRRRA